MCASAARGPSNLTLDRQKFRDLYDPTNAITQAVISFFFCIAFGLFYVRSVVKNRATR